MAMRGDSFGTAMVAILGVTIWAAAIVLLVAAPVMPAQAPVAYRYAGYLRPEEVAQDASRLAVEGWEIVSVLPAVECRAREQASVVPTDCTTTHFLLLRKS